MAKVINGDSRRPLDPVCFVCTCVLCVHVVCVWFVCMCFAVKQCWEPRKKALCLWRVFYFNLLKVLRNMEKTIVIFYPVGNNNVMP